MANVKYNEKILFCGAGGGLLSVEGCTGAYKAFEEAGCVPGKAMTASGSTLFSSIYYSVENIQWFLNFIKNTPEKDFIGVDYWHLIKSVKNGINHVMNNDKVFELLKSTMTGNASKRVTTSVTRNDDWTSHMKKVTPGWVIAATSIPLVFKPVKIGGSQWSDGGLLNNIPVPTLEECRTKYDHVFVFIPPDVKELGESGSLAGHMVTLLLALMKRENHQLKEMGYFDLPNVHLIKPTSACGGNVLKWSDNMGLVEDSYNVTMEVLKDAKLV